jgi:hypothetical protein
MVSVHKITGIWVEDIEKIEVTDPERPDADADYKRTISMWTTNGEKVELILEATSSEQLAFKEPNDSWLTPKVYKGRTEEDSSDES